MSTSEMTEECSYILSCLPHINALSILTLLTKHSHHQRNKRLKLALADLFLEEDERDNIFKQQLDIDCICKLVPHVSKSRVSSLVRCVGNVPNRREVVLRLALKDVELHPTRKSKSRNGEERNRVCAATVSCSGSVEDEAEQSLESNTCTNVVDCDERNVRTESSSNIQAGDSDDLGINQPSTSRAVWNHFSRKYQDDTAVGVIPDDVIEFPCDDPVETSKDRKSLNAEAEIDSTMDVILDSDETVEKEIMQKVLNFSRKEEVSDVVLESFPVIDFNTEVVEVPKGGPDSSSSSHLNLTTNKDPVISNISDDSANEVNDGVLDETLYHRVMEMFPQVCPKYLKSLCKGKTFSESVLDELITTLLSEEYPFRTDRPQSPELKLDPEEQYEILVQVLPDADPTYLRLHCDRLADKPEELKEFISNAIETREYPTMKDYTRKQQLSAQQRQYTTEFKLEGFLEVIPDPVAYFEDKKRTAVQLKDVYDVHYATACLRNEFLGLPVTAIAKALKEEPEFMKAFKRLEEMQKGSEIKKLKTKRKRRPLPYSCQNIPLLQEIAYVTHKREIEEYLKKQEVELREEKEKAKKVGLVKTCMCCYDDEVLERETVTCDNGCLFCKQCVQRSVEVAFGDGKLDFPCLSNCTSTFRLQTLQSALNPKLFSKVAQKKQLEEVKAAGIEDLESCPFCDFATIPAETDKIFRCLNPDCMKESCRLCKEPSHIPLKCEEVENDEDVKRRTYIENKMSEALLKKCYKCGRSFIKLDGCNKITCTCGAMQCYVCGEAVSNYTHFNGQGGDQFDKCPLYSDTVALHEEAVMRGAEAAKAEVGGDPKRLKFDPTLDILDHYAELKRRAPPLPPGVAAARPPGIAAPLPPRLLPVPPRMLMLPRMGWDNRAIHVPVGPPMNLGQPRPPRRRRHPLEPPIPPPHQYRQF